MAASRASRTECRVAEEPLGGHLQARRQPPDKLHCQGLDKTHRCLVIAGIELAAKDPEPPASSRRS